jgi:hypothetical protein
VTSPASTPNIAYFLLQSADTDRFLWIDNPTFDNPTGAAKPDFVFDEQGLAWPRDFSVTQPGSTTVTLPVRRVNGSNGNIAISRQTK